MKMTNEEMGRYVEVLSSLKETGKLGYAVARNLRKMKDACSEYLNLRSELFMKYGRKNGERFEIPKKNLDAYISELGEIPQIEHEVEVFKVSEEEFIGGQMTSDQMSQLLWMIK